MGYANAVTSLRLLVAFGCYGLLLARPSVRVLWLVFGLTALVIVADFFDGLLARLFHESSKFGAWYDIAADRSIEIGFWIVFASLQWVSPWVAVIFTVRGIFVDGIRAFALEQGFTAFGEKTLMQSPLSKFLVSSNLSRTAYAVVKAFAFCLVIWGQIDALVLPYAIACVYLATIFCLVRGLPVLFDGAALLRESRGQQ